MVLSFLSSGPSTTSGDIITGHPDANARRLASEVLEQVKARPEIVRRELQGIAVKPNKYVIMTVDDAGRVTGVASEGRFTSLLKDLSTRGTSAETRPRLLGISRPSINSRRPWPMLVLTGSNVQSEPGRRTFVGCVERRGVASSVWGNSRRDRRNCGGHASR